MPESSDPSGSLAAVSLRVCRSRCVVVARDLSPRMATAKMSYNNRVHFTTNEDDTLICLIARRPAIYDPRHKLHKNQPLRDKIWREVATKVGRSVNECKKRWRSVRDTYSRMRRMHKLKPSVRYSRWPLAARLKFLDGLEHDKFGRPFKHHQTIDSPINENDESLDELAAAVDSNKIAEEEPSSFSEVLENAQTAVLRLESIPAEKATDQSVAAAAEQKAADRMEMLKELLKLKVCATHDDPVDAFFYGMAASVKKLPPSLIAEAKMKVCKIVIDLELQASSGKTLNPATYPIVQLKVEPDEDLVTNHHQIPDLDMDDNFDDDINRLIE